MAFLTARSPFFKTVLNGNWKEAKERVVRLPEDDPEIFGLYLHYVYTVTFAVQPDPLPHQYNCDQALLRLGKSYVLAEKLQDIDTKNNVLKTMAKSFTKCKIDIKKLTTIFYTGTPSTSPARRLIVDRVVFNGGDGKLKREYMSSLNREFLADLSHSLLMTRGPPVVWDPTRVNGAPSYMEEVMREE